MVRGLNQFQPETGVVIAYFEFDVSRTTESDTYDEGPIPTPFDPDLNQAVAYGSGPNYDSGTGYDQPVQSGLAFKPAKFIRCVWWRYNPPTQVQSEEGEYTLDTCSVRFIADNLKKAGLQHSLDPDLHFNDRLWYQGKLYRVERYTPKGQVFGRYTMVDIDGRQLKPDELQDSSMPFADEPGTETPWTPGEELDWSNRDITDDDKQWPVH